MMGKADELWQLDWDIEAVSWPRSLMFAATRVAEKAIKRLKSLPKTGPWTTQTDHQEPLAPWCNTLLLHVQYTISWLMRQGRWGADCVYKLVGNLLVGTGRDGAATAEAVLDGRVSDGIASNAEGISALCRTMAKVRCTMAGSASSGRIA
jgi:hypothetical protein